MQASLHEDLNRLYSLHDTTLGSMANYITTADFKHFQPMNANFGLFPPLEQRMRSKKDKNDAIANRALEQLAAFKEQRT